MERQSFNCFGRGQTAPVWRKFRTFATMTLSFHPLTLDDRETMQAVTLHSGRRNCNYNFANLAGWKFRYDTEVCVTENTVVLRYSSGGPRG